MSIHEMSSKEEQPEWLQQALKQLPREMTPAQDMWPDIAQKLNPPRRQWMPVALAASVILSVVSALGSWQVYQQRQDATALATLQNIRLQQIESPYEFARASYRAQWPQLKTKMDAGTAQVVEQNLAIIKQARDNIAKALQTRPDDPVLQQLMRQTLSQEIGVYEQLQKIQKDTSTRI